MQQIEYTLTQLVDRVNEIEQAHPTQSVDQRIANKLTERTMRHYLQKELIDPPAFKLKKNLVFTQAHLEQVLKLRQGLKAGIQTTVAARVAKQTQPALHSSPNADLPSTFGPLGSAFFNTQTSALPNSTELKKASAHSASSSLLKTSSFKQKQQLQEAYLRTHQFLASSQEPNSTYQDTQSLHIKAKHAMVDLNIQTKTASYSLTEPQLNAIGALIDHFLQTNNPTL